MAQRYRLSPAYLVIAVLLLGLSMTLHHSQWLLLWSNSGFLCQLLRDDLTKGWRFYVGACVLGGVLGAVFGKLSRGSPKRGLLHGLWLMPTALLTWNILYISLAILQFLH